MKAHYALLFASLAGCIQPDVESYVVAPDQKHVLVEIQSSVQSIDVDTLDEVARVSNVYLSDTFFSRDGSKFVTHRPAATMTVVPSAGGNAVDFDGLLAMGIISMDGSRVAFVANPGPCPFVSEYSCADLFSAPSTADERVRVVSGIRVLLNDYYYPGAAWPGGLIDRFQFAGNDTLLFTTADQALMSAPADGSSAPVLLASGIDGPYGRVVPTFWILEDGHVVVQDGAGLLLLDRRGGTQLWIADGSTATLSCDVPQNLFGVDPTCPVSSSGAIAAVVTPRSVPSTVQVFSLTGGTSFSVAAETFWMHFDSAGRFVFFDSTDFLAEALPSGAVRQIGHPGRAGEHELLTSPDGKWIAIPTFLSVGGPCVNCRWLQLLSTVTGVSSWVMAPPLRLDSPFAGTPANLIGYAFSPDSAALLLETPDRNVSVLPVMGGAARLVATDVDEADWAGARHIVVNRKTTVPYGVRIIEVR